ncbi:glycosyltransferase family 2 protein [Pedobacter nutrimenti]|uniref:glycosyltransferase family 2 protein n=1 Tax=Pedobacter nutrimenti TaxID=1241337 RepID=UPI0029309FF9|nr:glycosyltransferase family 2 protein [Pedobacter nutrimenti]
MEIPKVSICIPTYNQIHLLKKNLDSILMQEYHDYEIIITDDSSDDIVKDFIASYPPAFKAKMKYYKNNMQLGSPENWNEAIRKSSGKYIKIMHHDDWFNYSCSLQIFVDLLDNDVEASMGFVSSRIVNSDNFETTRINTPDSSRIEHIEKTPEILLYGNWLGPPSSMIFRKLEFDQYYDPNLKWFVDIDAYVYLLSKKSKLAFNPIEAVSIGSSAIQVTKQCEHNKTVNLFEFFYFLEKWGISDITENELILKKACVLLIDFDVKSRTEIRLAGFKGKLPKNLTSLIKYVNSLDD